MPFFGVFLLVGAMQAGSAASADPRVGTWTLTAAQSSMDPANRLVITPVPNGVHLVMSGEVHLDFTAASDGKGTPVAGNPAFDQIQLHRMGKRESEVKEMKAGAPVATVRDKLSADGKELTITTTNVGKAPQVSVWTRNGAVPAGKDLFAGEWTQDMGKTRVRQGEVLKIEAAGDGVRFSGDGTYTGGFDGKPHELKNSRNDTVQLSRVDARTVDAVYRRDEQVVQKDRFTVSADGKTMTVVSSGTLATGQKITENLTFSKQ